MEFNKRVLVTGASKGIGQAIAITLGKCGYQVLAHYNHDEKGALHTQNEIMNSDGKCQIISFDVCDREQVSQILTDDIEKNGPFYAMVLNAGVTRDGAFPTLSGDDWDSVLRTNLDGFYNVVKPCVMSMITAKKPARIVALSSVSGVMGNRGQVNYSASKAGLIGAVKSLAVELAKRNITVNCVAPGLIDTGMVTNEIFEHAKAMIPMQRMGNVNEVSSLVKYLLSDEASYITRQVISVNGGMF